MRDDIEREMFLAAMMVVHDEFRRDVRRGMAQELLEEKYFGSAGLFEHLWDLYLSGKLVQ